MPSTTSGLKIPYPLPTDRVTDYPTTAKTAAQTIDANLTPSAWVAVTESADWSKSDLKVRRMGNLVELRGYLMFKQRLPPGQWDKCVTIPAGYRPAAQINVPASIYVGGGSPTTKSAGAILVINTDGTTTVMASGYADSIDVQFTFILG